MRFNAVFFDFYNTLATFYPPKEELQKKSAKIFGLNLTKEGIIKGYRKADEWMSKEIIKKPLSKMSPQEKLSFFTDYEYLILSTNYPNIDRNLTIQVWNNVANYPTKFKLFDDVRNCLIQLKEIDLQIGILSNIETDSSDLLKSLKLNHLVDFMFNSADVGKPKPDPEIFLKALNLAKSLPKETVHIGDQIESDINGAKKLGIEAILIDRHDLYPNFKGSAKIQSLKNLNNLLPRL